MKRNAFTLAETLITLAIVGVVAILTLPNLIDGYKKNVYVGQLQRTYNMISNGAAQALVDEDAATLKDTYLGRESSNADDNAFDFLRTYFKVTRTCSSIGDGTCTETTYKSLKGQTFNLRSTTGGGYRCAVIHTGAAICLRTYTLYHFGGHPFISVIVDVNGKKKPNRAGRDLFAMRIKNDGTIGDLSGDYSEDGDCNTRSDTGYDSGCLGRIINDGWKMDY